MPIYEITTEKINPLPDTTFRDVGIHERRDLQRLLRDNISVIAPNTLIIAEEFGEWDESRRRIDLLGIDREANLVVIELKRTEDGGYMELQAIRYAAMVSTITFEQVVDAFERYLIRIGEEDTDARAKLLGFLEWSEPDDKVFAQDVRIVLASGAFSSELTTSILWLTEKYDMDIRCVRLQPYNLDNRVLIDVQQIIPLPEATEYQIQVREKARRERGARSSGADYTRYDLVLGAQKFTNMPKGRVIYLTFRHLVSEGGIDPEIVAKHCGRSVDRSLISVEGEVEQDEFISLARETRAAEGRNFEPKRFFCSDGELIVWNGRTYAFSTQWGGSNWLEAMKLLQEKYPEREIRFSPTE